MSIGENTKIHINEDCTRRTEVVTLQPQNYWNDITNTTWIVFF